MNNLVNLVSITAYISLISQILTEIIQFFGLFINLQPKYEILKDALKLEIFVQIVEAAYYIWLFFNLDKTDIITQTRYYDWVLTTPIMLLSTIIFFVFKNEEQFSIKNKTELKTLEFFSLINNNKSKIFIILLFNFLMLLFGYFGEISLLPNMISVLIGTIFFLLSFGSVYNYYVKDNKENLRLFLFIFIIWGLYGIAALFPFAEKNIMYNLLDIVSKNFYGLYLYYQISKYNNKD